MAELELGQHCGVADCRQLGKGRRGGARGRPLMGVLGWVRDAGRGTGQWGCRSRKGAVRCLPLEVPCGLLQPCMTHCQGLSLQLGHLAVCPCFASRHYAVFPFFILSCLR